MASEQEKGKARASSAHSSVISTRSQKVRPDCIGETHYIRKNSIGSIVCSLLEDRTYIYHEDCVIPFTRTSHFKDEGDGSYSYTPKSENDYYKGLLSDRVTTLEHVFDYLTSRHTQSESEEEIEDTLQTGSQEKTTTDPDQQAATSTTGPTHSSQPLPSPEQPTGLGQKDNTTNTGDGSTSQREPVTPPPSNTTEPTTSAQTGPRPPVTPLTPLTPIPPRKPRPRPKPGNTARKENPKQVPATTTSTAASDSAAQSERTADILQTQPGNTAATSQQSQGRTPTQPTVETGLPATTQLQATGSRANTTQPLGTTLRSPTTQPTGNLPASTSQGTLRRPANPRRRLSSDNEEEMVKLRDIDSFTGERGSTARAFMDKCELAKRQYNFEADTIRDTNGTQHPADLPDQQLIVFALQHCKDNAYSWAKPYIDKLSHVTNQQQDPIWGPRLFIWDTFKQQFLKQFSSLSAERSAETKLKTLRQGNGNVHTYAAKFRELAEQTQWNESAKLAVFSAGLSGEIRERLDTQISVPSTYSDYVDAAIRIGETLDAARDSKTIFSGRTSRPTNFAAIRNTTSNFRPNRSSNYQKTSFRSNNGPRISPAQIQEYRQNNKCFRCGMAGHIARNCRVSQKSQGNIRGRFNTKNTANASSTRTDRRRSNKSNNTDDIVHTINGIKGLRLSRSLDDLQVFRRESARDNAY